MKIVPTNFWEFDSQYINIYCVKIINLIYYTKYKYKKNDYSRI